MENKTSLNSGRVYALDALRAFMMLLGLVLHSAITYGSIDYKTVWELKDPNNKLIFDLIVKFIHVFRMPVFFVVAGYFAGLLFYKKGPKAMLINRIKRILFPLLAGVLFICPLVVFSSAFSQLVFAGATAPFNNALEILSEKFLHFNVIHLWFLYFLMIYAVISWLFAMLFKKPTGFTSSINKILTYILGNFWLRLLLMSLLFFPCLYRMHTTYILTNNNWQINPSIFIMYLMFFGIGWMIYKTNTLIKFEGYAILQLGIATVLFLVSAFMHESNGLRTGYFKMLLASVYTPLFIYGFISFFLKYFNHYSRGLSYLVDASYWVYIIHLPVVALIPGLITNLTSIAFIKFTITFLTTSIICMVSYKYLVRGSFIGMFLNGKVIKQNKMRQTREPVMQL